MTGWKLPVVLPLWNHMHSTKFSLQWCVTTHANCRHPEKPTRASVSEEWVTDLSYSACSPSRGQADTTGPSLCSTDYPVWPPGPNQQRCSYQAGRSKDLEVMSGSQPRASPLEYAGLDHSMTVKLWLDSKGSRNTQKASLSPLPFTLTYLGWHIPTFFILSLSLGGSLYKIV